jgi:neutral trehalase
LTKEKYNYDEEKMYYDNNFPFKVKDIMFTSILYVANKYLAKIGEILDEDTSQVKEWTSRTEHNFYKYFTLTQKLDTMEEDDLYDYDLVKKGWIKKRTIASLVPIFTGIIPREKIDVLVRWINHAHYCGVGNCHIPVLPRTDVDEAYFKPLNYWRGPIWININWMVYQGLVNYGYRDRAEQIKQEYLS